MGDLGLGGGIVWGELVEQSMLKTYMPKLDDVEKSKPYMAMLRPEQVKPGGSEG